MRRSSAPSRKFKSPVAGITPPLSINENVTQNPIKSTTTHQSTVRSTSSILNLLKKKPSEPLTSVPEPSTSIPESSTVNKTPLKEVTSRENANKTIYNVVWGKKSTKKHKTWEGDGIFEITNRSGVLKDCEGNIMGRASNIKTELIEEGYILSVGGKEVQIGDLVPVGTQMPTPKRSLNEENNTEARPIKKPKYKSTLNNSLTLTTIHKRKGKFSLDFEPLVFPQPNSEHQWTYNEYKKPVVDVSVDSCLAKVLRRHQRQGVVFLYESVMGYRQLENFGAILADEMGLGKTLQCITVVWTLLKQGPYGGTPIINRVLVVTPSSLTGNWENEFLSWLGRERIRVFVVDNKNKPKDFQKYPHIPILIISYEMFARCFDELNQIQFDLLICDEGHRLKNNSIKISTLLNQLECKRRVILTGTPIQNDLQEFYALVNFVNPGCLGTTTEYRKYYEEPILASREPDMEEDIKNLGEKRAQELNKKTSYFILRRTQEILEKYLPTKTECVVFCKSSALQQQLLRSTCELWTNRDVSAKEIAHLSIITGLKKICNHPTLVKTDDSDLNLPTKLLPSEQSTLTVNDSGKLKVLLELLRNMSEVKDKLVIVSSYTQTLDVLANLCVINGYKYCRLDGSVPSHQRTKIVEQFNNKWSSDLVFLLSAKAGGVGLNLIGASRLVLFDSDWNPATDLQAMARIWRDGQKKSVFLYRFLTTGTIEEKIFQRQISKTGLSGTIVDPSNQSSIRMSDEELKDLFNLQFDSDCSTHTILNCDCPCDGSIPEPSENIENERTCQLGQDTEPSQSLRMNQLMQWEHHKQPYNEQILKELRLENVSADISFIFRNKCSL